MYGPPPDPRQVLLATDLAQDPLAWAVCLALGAALTAVAISKRLPGRVRAAAFVCGQVILLTAPAMGHLDTAVLGSFPTIDKEGSLLFYLDGVHIRMLLDPLGAPADPAARLIGVHTGHLWVTQLFDVALSPLGAFNAQAFTNLALGWICAALLFSELGAPAGVALTLGFAWGLGLHPLRDINWYTIEKSAVFWLPLFAWSMLRARARGGVWLLIPAFCYGLLSWMNLYFGLVTAALGAAAFAASPLLKDRTATRRIWWACVGCAATGLPLALWQAHVMAGGPQLATPEQFLWERAALDGFSLSPLRWNRLELWSALNPVVMGMVAYFGWRARAHRGAWAVAATAALLWLLSIGPVLWPGAGAGVTENPLYMAVRAVVPGFWRIAKPEVFFFGTWLLMLSMAAVGAARLRIPMRSQVALYLSAVACWLALVRPHPAYPPLTAATDATLSDGWEQRTFQGR